MMSPVQIMLCLGIPNESARANNASVACRLL